MEESGREVMSMFEFEAAHELLGAEPLSLEMGGPAGHVDVGNRRFVMLIEFSTMQRLMDLYDSPEYKPWRELRERSARASIVVTEA
jgi:uncharacterized protein (DUF1330 family)